MNKNKIWWVLNAMYSSHLIRIHIQQLKEKRQAARHKRLTHGRWRG